MRQVGLAICLILVAAPASAAVCTNPPPHLTVGQADVDAETIPFSNDSRSYSLDIYSGFAPQYQSPQANWCMRYEAELTSHDPIEKFDWPLAGIQMDLLDPMDRQSKVVTGRPGKAPSIADTNLSAFKSIMRKSRAYQIVSLATGQEVGAVDRSKRRNGQFWLSGGYGSKSAFFQLIADEIPSPDYLDRIPFSQPNKLVAVGADFSGSKAALTMSSFAYFDGKTFTILASIEFDSVSEMRAPFLSALAKSRSPREVIDQLKETGDQILPPKTPYNVKAEFSAEAMSERALYVVQQPISFRRPNGRVCFTAPVYSPVSVPAAMLSCNLFK